MANATFHEGSYSLGTNDTVYLKYLKANYREITFRYIGNQSVPNSGYYGINGTYFDNGPNLLGIAMDNGNYIRTGGSSGYNGEQNRVPARACGTYVVFKNSINGTDGVCGKISSISSSGFTFNGTTYSKSDIRLAVGGTSLYTGKEYDSLTKSQFYSNIWPSEDPGGMDANGNDGYAPRTAIIYTGGSSTGLNTILLTVIGQDSQCSPRNGHGCTLWQLREIIRTYSDFKVPNGDPPMQAINLDGGGSTQICYKNSSGQKKHFYVDNDGQGGMRSVQSMLCVTM